MNKSTSKDMMKREFDILNQLPRLEPPAHLHDKIMSRIAEGKKMTVSKKWLVAAAASFALIVLLEGFVILHASKSNSNEIEILVQDENYQLYE